MRESNKPCFLNDYNYGKFKLLKPLYTHKKGKVFDSFAGLCSAVANPDRTKNEHVLFSNTEYFEHMYQPPSKEKQLTRRQAVEQILKKTKKEIFESLKKTSEEEIQDEVEWSIHMAGKLLNHILKCKAFPSDIENSFKIRR